MAPYKYQPFDDSTRETRIMVLHPGTREDILRVSLETVSLPSDDLAPPPRYEALSYAWGSRENPVDLSVVAYRHGVTTRKVLRKLAPAWSHLRLKDQDPLRRVESGTIGITQNLAAALPYLRLEDRERRLWIDAVCVNQQDLAERGSQMKQMASIFSQADLVIAWIGLDRPDCRVAFDFMTWLGTNVAVNWNKYAMSSISEDYPGLANFHEELEMSQADSDAIICMMGRPWFRRLWVRQEVQMARQALLMCGSSAVDWNVFRNAVFCLYTKRIIHDSREEMESLETHLIPTFDVVNYSDIPQGLGETLRRARLCLCEDPRDRLYALMNVITSFERQAWSIEPDYTLSTRHVYEEASRSYMEAMGAVDLLRYCDIGTRSHIPGLPTWVPSWDCLDKLASSLPQDSADCHTLALIGRESGQDLSVLSCKGLDVAIVRKRFEFRLDNVDNLEVVRELRRIFHSLKDHIELHHVGDKVHLTALPSVLLGGIIYELWDPPYHNAPTAEAARAAVAKLWDIGLSDIQCAEDLSTRELARFVGRVRFMCRGRALFITDGGKLGIGPKSLAEGDHICVLLGCWVPLAIRPVPNGSRTTYLVVGECYGDSLMAGEAILGPLPYGWRMLQKHQENRYYWPAFRETPASAPQREDPRLKLLLGDDYDERHQSRFGERTQEEEDDMIDKVTKARGLEWRTFNFV
ncbi:hypothetical protein LTR85_006350 [Meristemomyces frigidus]|nr:hypothetical protein LTR85_006350 [Meristemomyces frigidus]